MDAENFSYYDVLEVSPVCGHFEVSAAYERLKATYSGDNPAIYSVFSESEAREYLRLVEEAFLFSETRHFVRFMMKREEKEQLTKM